MPEMSVYHTRGRFMEGMSSLLKEAEVVSTQSNEGLVLFKSLFPTVLATP